MSVLDLLKRTIAKLVAAASTAATPIAARLGVGSDKVLHFAAGLAVAVVAFGLTASAIYAVVATLVAAVAREAWNLNDGGAFDLRDIAATLLGAVPVVFFALLLP